MECFAFKAADNYLGVEARYVYRVVDVVEVTPVPLVPPCYMGLIYYRGELFDVVHMGRLMGQGPTLQESPRIILLRWSHKKLGLIPDRILGLLWIEDGEQREEAFSESGYAVKLISPDEILNTLSGLSYGPHQV